MAEFHRPLGNSGLIVSATGLGCNNLGRKGTITEHQDGVNTVIGAAIDAGITYFDIADMYGSYPGQSEEMFAKAVKGRRDEVVIGTKFGMSMEGKNGPDFNARGSRRYIMRAIEASLQRLETDHIDLYHYHQLDEVTPIEETLTALNDLVTQGKVRYLGGSNFPGWRIAEADWAASALGAAHFISAQNEYSLLNRQVEAEVVPSAEHHGVSIIPYFPLFNGLLTGKYSKDANPSDGRITNLKPHLLTGADWGQLQAFGEFARARGVTEVEVAIGWLLAQPSVDTVIAGATTMKQIEQNVAAASAWNPTREDLDELDTIFPRVPAAGGYKRA